MVKSDILDSVRAIAELFHPLDTMVGTLLQFRIIVDACYINSELRWILGRRQNPESRTNLQEIIDAGTVRVYAPACIEAELEEHYPEISTDLGVSVERIHQEWLVYKKRLRLYNPKRTLPGDVSISDVDDVDYGIAFFELAANALLTEDKGFDGSGVPTINKHLVIELRTYSRDSAYHYSFYYGTATLGMVAGPLLEEFIKFVPVLWASVKSIAKQIKIFLLVAVLFVLIHPGLRKTVFEKLQLFHREFTEMLNYALVEFASYCDKVIEKKKTADEALLRICDAGLKPSAPVWRHVYMILFERNRPFSVERLSAKILESGYFTRSKNFVKYVKQVLRSKPFFAEMDDGKWGLANWAQRRNRSSTTA